MAVSATAQELAKGDSGKQHLPQDVDLLVKEARKT